MEMRDLRNSVVNDAGTSTGLGEKTRRTMKTPGEGVAGARVPNSPKNWERHRGRDRILSALASPGSRGVQKGLCLHPPPPPPTRGAKETAPRCNSRAPSSFRFRGHNSAPDEKKAERGASECRGVAGEARFRSWASDLGGQGRAGPAGDATFAFAPEPPGPRRAGALGSPGRRAHGPAGSRGQRSLPGSAQVSAGPRPQHPQAALLQLPRRSPEPRAPGGAPRVPAPARRAQVPVPAPDAPRRRLPPTLIFPRRPEKVWPGPAGRRPHSPRAARGGGGGIRGLRERRAPHSGPFCPDRDRAVGGEEAAVSPARSPTPPRHAARRRPRSARRRRQRQVPARGWREEPPAGRGLRPRPPGFRLVARGSPRGVALGPGWGPPAVSGYRLWPWNRFQFFLSTNVIT
ncbi:PREDICTED: collagen alpha-1(I) chain-like [Condylura cristata]|uniref:collagen alpha-1(I) chain-like n=1 Tax=Condylura cristata TaxID=143302 RepID=UPI000642EB78|nr:PREDICTED: collagen alpha-1(I) chain-like [Condylura cristata]